MSKLTNTADIEKGEKSKSKAQLESVEPVSIEYFLISN